MKAARLGDCHECAETGEYPDADLKIQEGSPNIFINDKPAARVGDKLTCKLGHSTVIAEGSSTVFFNGKPAARMGDAIKNGGSIKEGSPNVIIGDGGTLIKFGDGTKVKFGDGCKVMLSCSDSKYPGAVTNTANQTKSIVKCK